MSLHFQIASLKMERESARDTKRQQALIKASEQNLSQNMSQNPPGWSELARWFGQQVREILNRIDGLSINEVEEIRLRVRQPLLVLTNHGEIFLNASGASVESHKAYRIEVEDIRQALDSMTYSSLYAAEQELRQGFLTLPGGHRVGVTGEVVMEQKQLQLMKNITSMNFRVAHEVLGTGLAVLPNLLDANKVLHHTLILSSPRAGKTTLLRDLIRLLSNGVPALRLPGQTVGVVDERGELAGMWQGRPAYDLGSRTDVLDACPKGIGMGMLVRSMAPQVIATDEMGSVGDIQAVEDAVRTGVRILSTAHAGSLEEALTRPILKILIEQGVFKRLVILSRRNGPGTIENILTPENQGWENHIGGKR